MIIPNELATYCGTLRSALLATWLLRDGLATLSPFVIFGRARYDRNKVFIVL